ncbi:response regulator transcription factor [Lacrimispora sphenoides]|uniref:Stage 0 sporulation protein A homolog n=1 Tax=Lacrimispora sphenoides JCM 1415 TaxID=1297793 RepID=A0ABY1CEA4_9FIRM|nr:response regulator transcription factor [Lacrimispora sphenoides]SET97076.1 DNA-binding response regulator, OmpR family, contains REC and winged-helix (wHTH) domain [[Clostridium] sphenoides JCM 1415]SUY52836.1 two component transcriptional regulator [Lacrimispora sphenoides]
MYHNKKILLVDDEAGLLDMLKITLKKERFTDITCAYTAKEALNLVKNTNFDLLVLDVMLPDLSGFELCSQIRQFSFAPIIFLTACAGDLDKVTGLALGGDDYITKPFNPLEVTARIKAILRRQTQYAESAAKINHFDYGLFQVNLDNATLMLEGNLVECTAKEFELLCFFCKHPNYVFTSAQIYEAVWEALGYGEEKTVTMHISKLRKKLGDDAKNPSIILNLRGLGYKFVPPKKV